MKEKAVCIISGDHGASVVTVDLLSPEAGDSAQLVWVPSATRLCLVLHAAANVNMVVGETDLQTDLQRQVILYNLTLITLKKIVQTMETKGLFQFEIIINVLVNSL